MKISKPQARKDYKCSRCQVDILKGESYYTYKHAYRSRSIRCLSHYPRPSELTTSDKLARLYGIQEELEDYLKRSLGKATDVDEITGILTNAIDEARAVGSEYEESADNIVDGFGHETSMSEEIREKASACETWADSMESLNQDIETTWEDAVENEKEIPEDPDRDAMVEEHFETARNDVASLVDDAIQGLEI